jgi:hypothetical protein
MPVRKQRLRTSGWRRGDNCMIVDRTSDFGNPFTIAAAMDAFGYTEAEARKTVVGEFGPWLRGSRSYWESDEGDRRREKILARLHELRGKDLACPCEPEEACHADTLLEWGALSVLALEVRIASVRARVDRQRTARGEEAMYDADALAAVLMRDVTVDCLVDFDPGDGIPQRCDNRTWNYYLRRQRLHEDAVTVRLVEVFA